MPQKLAIIDLGTNTFHLLLAEQQGNKYLIIHREKVAVKLGMGGINQDIIQEDAINRAIETLKKFKTKIEETGTTKIYAFGTSALRNAINAREVTNRIKQSTGIEINIISGDDEAEFIYHGVRSAVNLDSTPALIMDIGGGSVEFIIGDQNRIFWKQSIEIGAQRLLEKFQHHDPITADEIRNLDQYFEATLLTLQEAILIHKPLALVGSSGTFDTLSNIHCISNSILSSSEDPEIPLTHQSFFKIYKELISKDQTARLRIPGMIEMRVDMIVVACCLIRFILDKNHFDSIRVSSYSLKEGVLESLTDPSSPVWEDGNGL